MNFNPYQQINQTHGHIFHRSVNSTNSVEVELKLRITTYQWFYIKNERVSGWILRLLNDLIEFRLYFE